MKLNNSQRIYIGTIVAVAIASVAYRILVWKHLEQTSLLFIGIPTILGILAVLIDTPSTAAGASVRAVTLGLLLAGPLLGEGLICLLISAPIFYVVALLVGGIIDFFRKREEARRFKYFSVVLFLPMLLEGATPTLSFPREEFVSARRTIVATPSQIETALSQPPRVTETLPRFLRIGFPHPTEAHGEGLAVGSQRVIHFAGGEGHPGDLTMRIASSEPGHVLFFADSDRSKIAHWLDWRSAEVTWHAVDSTHTEVVWKIGFTRRLDPAWYFRPWERLAAQQAAEFLITANATPQGN